MTHRRAAAASWFTAMLGSWGWSASTSTVGTRSGGPSAHASAGVGDCETMSAPSARSGDAEGGKDAIAVGDGFNGANQERVAVAASAVSMPRSTST